METDGTDGTKIHFLRGESTPLRLKTVECDFALCVCVFYSKILFRFTQDATQVLRFYFVKTQQLASHEQQPIGMFGGCLPEILGEIHWNEQSCGIQVSRSCVYHGFLEKRSH